MRGCIAAWLAESLLHGNGRAARIFRGLGCRARAVPGKARIIEQEHRIYSEALRIVIAGNYRIEERRVIPG